MQDYNITKKQLKKLEKIGNKAMRKASKSLLKLVGKDISITTTKVEIFEFSELYKHFDTGEKIVASVVLKLVKGLWGHIVIMLSNEDAKKFVKGQ